MLIVLDLSLDVCKCYSQINPLLLYHQGKSLYLNHVKFHEPILLCNNYCQSSTFHHIHVSHHPCRHLDIDYHFPKWKYRDQIFYQVNTHLRNYYNFMLELFCAIYLFHVSYHFWTLQHRLKYFSIYTNHNHVVFHHYINLCKYPHLQKYQILNHVLSKISTHPHIYLHFSIDEFHSH